MQKNSFQQLSATVDPDWRIGIIASSFYREEIDALVAGAVSTLENAGLKKENIQVHEVSGSFEVPLIGAVLAEGEKVDALIGLGIIIEGKTHHARLLAEAATKGIMDTQLQYRMPFAFEILYADSLSLARQRLGKGSEAAWSVLHSLAKLRSLRS